MDVTMTPKTNIIYFWRHQDTPNNSRNIQKYFTKIIFMEIQQHRKSIFPNNLEQTRAEKSRISVSFVFENLEYGINIFQKNINGDS